MAHIISNGNGGYSVSKAFLGVLALLFTIIGVVASAVYFAATVRANVDSLEKQVDHLNSQDLANTQMHTEQTDRLARIETKIDSVSLDIKDMKADIKDLQIDTKDLKVQVQDLKTAGG